MKRLFLQLFVGILLTGAVFAQDAQHMIGRQTQNEGFFAVPAKGAVKIDGKLDEWDLSGQIWSYADTSVRDSFSVKTAAMWDADNLYMSFVWRDPMPLNSTVDPKFDPERGWNADAVQLRVLAGRQPSWFTCWGFDKGTKPAVHTYYWADENKDTGGTTILRYTGKAGEAALGDGVESAYALLPDGKGFIHELKLPWKVVYKQDWKGAADQTLRIGMEFLWGNETGRGSMHRYADNMQPGVTSREFYWTGKKSWGDLTTVAESVKEPRRYVEGSLKPQGTIPVRAQVPADATTFSVVIDDLQGNRVRNLAGGYGVADFTVAKDGKTATVEVMWDGLDEAGKLVPPGNYKVRGLTQGGIDGYYEMSFYNPGTPPWQTNDNIGAWGADHTSQRLVARSGENMIITCDFAEGGYGTFAVKPDGTKAWSEKRGANVLAATPDFVYTVPNDWGVSGVQLLRMNAKDGSFAPFVRDGKELPMPLHFRDLMGLTAPADGAEIKPPKARALAVADGVLILATDDNRLWLFDANTVKLIKQTTLELTGFDGKYPFAFDGKQLYFFRQKELVKVNLDALKSEADPVAKATVVTLNGAVEQPGAIAFDAAGNLYITDLGKDLQVKKFAPDGNLLGRMGKTGGRARQGAFDPQGMRDMAGLAVDAAGNAWVAEYSHHPRRVSVWQQDGALKRDFIGNTGYSGQGSFTHDSDPTKGVAELNEIKLDPATRKWNVESVMYNPDPAKGDFVMPGDTAFGSGNVFFSEASGKRHEYFVALGEFRNTPVFVMIKVGKDWQPVAGMFTVARLQGLLGGMYGSQIVKNPGGDYADNDPCDMLIWNDLNNDGYVQKTECEIIPPLKKSGKVVDGKPAAAGGIALPIGGFGGGGRVDPADFSFFAEGCLKTADNKGMFKVKPLRFRDDGRPVLGAEGFTKLPAEFGLMEAVPVPGKDLVVGFINLQNKVYVAGFTKSEGKILWKYLSPYHQVHGSHKAPMAKPGMLIGCLKIAGIVEKCGDADGVFMIRGNLGEDYYLTTDGVFVDILTKDGRIPGIRLPENEAALRAVSFASLNGRGEHFSGVISRQADGVVRCTGAVPASQAGNIIRIEGLESIRRFTAADVNVTQEALVKADQDNTRRALDAARPPEPYTIAAAQKDAKGQVDWKSVKPLSIRNDGQPVTGEFRAAYDNDNLYVSYNVNDPAPWKNGGNEFRLLFKTGDCVDFQLSPSGNTTGKAVAGDLRVVMANFNGKPVAVLMKPVAPGAPAADKFNFTSPVMTVTFDQVKLLTEVTPTVAVRGNGYTVTAALPWAILGVEPKAELKLRGDAGFILSDPSGTINAARVYWSNKHTGLVMDQPGEALITPQGFGEFVLGKEGRWRTAFVNRRFVGAFQDVWLKGPGSVIRSSTPIPFDGTKVKVQVTGCHQTVVELEQLSLVKGMDEKGRVEGPRYPILFEGHPTVSFTTGTQAWSDEIAIPIKRGTWYVQDSYRSSKMPYAWDGNGGSCDAKGSEAKESLASTIKSCRVGILTRIDVFTTDTRPGIVCYGDSITHGAGATPNAGMSYPDQLAKILDRPVLNLGVNGDRIPGTTMAIASLKGVDIVLFLMGINDILTGSVKSASEYAAKMDPIVKGLTAQKLRVLIGTLPPAGGYKQFDENPNLEKLRQEINGWIRTSSGADKVIDFDKALSDPAVPSRMKKEWQFDWLHPNDQGYKKMAETAAEAISVSAERMVGATLAESRLPSVKALAGLLTGAPWHLPCTVDYFMVEECPAFVIRPRGERPAAGTPWVWYAPVIDHPNRDHVWMLRQWLAQGIGIAGVDVGESFGNPRGRKVFSALWETATSKYGMSKRACLLPQSRGGLMLYNWAAENPERIACIAGIYTVCDLRSFPGLERACGAYAMTAAELEARLGDHNPVDRLASLAKAGVPIIHVHGDSDQVVPLEQNAGEVARRYKALGGAVRLIVIPGKGHEICAEFFKCQELVDFVASHARVVLNIVAASELSTAGETHR